MNFSMMMCFDLESEKGYVQALVCGSRRNPYTVTVGIEEMPKQKWQALVDRMTGKISSLMALAAGKLPKELLADFCNVETGLFPKPREIDFSCSCPDGATCCKHVAAVLYAIGARLDNEPELFFTLRGVDPKSIVTSESVVDSLTSEASSELDASDLGDVFGISLDDEVSESVVPEVKLQDSFAAQFKAIRKQLGLSQFELARRLGTSQTTISLIERGKCESKAAFLIKPLLALR